MKDEVLDFKKLLQERTSQSRYESSLEEIRSTYHKEIPEADVVTPHVIYKLEAEKKRLDRRWGETGRISVEAANYSSTDARATLVYESGDIFCSVYQLFNDGGAKSHYHRAMSSLTPNLGIDARIVHSYFEGDELWARASKDRSHWEIMHTFESTGRAVLRYRTKNFCNLRSLEKILKRLETEEGILKTGSRATD